MDNKDRNDPDVEQGRKELVDLLRDVMSPSLEEVREMINRISEETSKTIRVLRNDVGQGQDALNKLKAAIDDLHSVKPAVEEIQSAVGMLHGDISAQTTRLAQQLIEYQTLFELAVKKHERIHARLRWIVALLSLIVGAIVIIALTRLF